MRARTPRHAVKACVAALLDDATFAEQLLKH